MIAITPQSAAQSVITVTSTATSLLNLLRAADATQEPRQLLSRGINAVMLKPEDGNVRIMFGTTPTASLGLPIEQTSTVSLPADFEGMKLIRTGSSDVLVSVMFLILAPGESLPGPSGSSVASFDGEIGAVEIKDGSTNGRGVVEAPADGASNATLGLVTNSRLEGFGGTTWDRIKAGITTVTATLTGFLNVLPWGVYNATPSTRTEGQGGPLQTTTLGHLLTNSLAQGATSSTAPTNGILGGALFGSNMNALQMAGNLGDANNGSGQLAVTEWQYNGTTYDRRNGNSNITVLTSGARTTTQTSSDLTNYNSKGLKVVLDMTNVGTGNVTLTINGKDSISGKYYPILTGAAVSTNSTNVYTVYPGVTVAANAAVSDVIPRTYQVVVTANNANSATYSVGASVIN